MNHDKVPMIFIIFCINCIKYLCIILQYIGHRLLSADARKIIGKIFDSRYYNYVILWFDINIW